MKLALLPARKFFELQKNPSANLDEVEAQFFTRLRLANRTFKTTSTSRLSDFNDLIISVLPESIEPLNLLDVAISSGVTTVDFMEQLSQKGIRFSMTATDLYIDAELLTYASWFCVLVDHNGYPLQYEMFGVGVCSWISPRDFLSGAFIGVCLGRLIHYVFDKLSSSPRTKKQKLISARVEQTKHVVELSRDDIFVKNPEYTAKFDLIRAPNILNLSYFSEAQLRAAIVNLRTRLKVGGILAVCRTHAGGVNHGSLFRKVAENRFELITSLGAGSEISHLIAAEST
jgi:hypothetical protein